MRAARDVCGRQPHVVLLLDRSQRVRFASRRVPQAHSLHLADGVDVVAPGLAARREVLRALEAVAFERDLPTVLAFFFQAEDGIRDYKVTGVQTCALPI